MKVLIPGRENLGPVRIMAVAEGYAMVRRPRCYPFVIALKELKPTNEFVRRFNQATPAEIRAAMAKAGLR